jgi:hypothetical protein
MNVMIIILNSIDILFHMVPCMLGLDSTWAPSRQITQLGPILRFEFPTKEAEIQALPSLKSKQRTAYRGTSG